MTRLKKLIALIVSIITVTNLFIISRGSNTYYLGDIDGDGNINISEAIAILEFSRGKKKDINIKAADVNMDNKINSLDAFYALCTALKVKNKIQVEETIKVETTAETTTAATKVTTTKAVTTTKPVTTQKTTTTTTKKNTTKATTKVTTKATTKPTTTTKKVTTTAKASSHYKTYSDSTMKIYIDKIWFRNAYCYVADVRMTNYKRMFTCRAGSGYTDTKKTPSVIAAEKGAILTVNCDSSATGINNPVVRNGVVLNWKNKTCSAPALYSQQTGCFGSTSMLGVGNMTFADAVSKGLVTDSFCWGPAFNFNGKNAADSYCQRTFIGTDGTKGHVIIVVTEGRNSDGKSKGLTQQDCADLLKKYGCTFGVPLDGGGSSAMIFRGQRLNHVSSERAVTDFVCFK